MTVCTGSFTRQSNCFTQLILNLWYILCKERELNLEVGNTAVEGIHDSGQQTTVNAAVKPLEVTFCYAGSKMTNIMTFKY